MQTRIRPITISMDLGRDEKVVRLEKRLARRGLQIHKVDYHCDIGQDREQVTFHVQVPVPQAS